MFTTGGGSADPLNWSNDEAALYPVSQFKGMRPASGRTIDMFFETSFGKEVVTLGIKNMTHTLVMKSITQAIEAAKVVATIADVDNAVYCSPYIQTVTIASQETFVQKLNNGGDNVAPTKLDIQRSNYSSCLISNTSTATNVDVSFYIVEGVSTDITSTGVYAAETEGISGSSVTLNVDNGSGGASAAIAQILEGEKVYKSDGTLFGTCTSVSSTTQIVFSGGLTAGITNNDILYIHTRYFRLHEVIVPFGATLKLEQDEISFDNSKYDLYAYSDNSSGHLDVSFIY
mgnify:CR=1 FL=1